MTTTTTIRSGVWTPWAEALCATCHQLIVDGETSPGYWRDRSIAVQAHLDADEHLYHTPTLGRCTTNGHDRRGCGAPIWLPPDVAMLTRIKPAFALSRLIQTGGMCAALEIQAGDDLVIVSALDGPVIIGRYREADWRDCGEPVLRCLDLPDTASDADIIESIWTVLDHDDDQEVLP